MDFIEIDGSQGEGGGQILRTSISLSACTGQAIKIINIRSGRKKPGLMRQHLCCVNAAAEVCNTKVKGASLGSKMLEFIPGDISAGNYHFSIGSAGSTCLVFQTVLPLFLLTKKPSTLIFTGGTHNPMAPSYDFLKNAFLPILAKMGLNYNMSIEQYGFFPVGGGSWRIDISPPKSYKKIEIETRGNLLKIEAKCISAGIPGHVTQREKKTLRTYSDWSNSSITTENVKSLGSGNIVSILAVYENASEVIDSIGSVGVRAEKVARNALTSLEKYQSSNAPIGEYLAGQLLLPLSVTSGGAYVTGKLSEHTKTNIEVIKKITGSKIKLESVPKKQWKICIG
ncbi:MAG: RNA 3'-terminal phosphate cyclase [Methylococcaceae bacterium]